VTGAPVGGPVGQSHSFQGTGIVSRRFHALDVHRQVLEVPLPGRVSDPFGQDVPDPLPVGDLHQEPRDLVRLAVIDLVADLSPAHGLDGEGAKVSGRDGVHAHAVAEIVQVGDLFDLLDHAQASEGVDGFVFGAFDDQPLVAPLLDGRQPPARHEAPGAGMGPNLVLPVEGLPADPFPVLAAPGRPVPGRERPGLV